MRNGDRDPVCVRACVCMCVCVRLSIMGFCVSDRRERKKYWREGTELVDASTAQKHCNFFLYICTFVSLIQSHSHQDVLVSTPAQSYLDKVISSAFKFESAFIFVKVLFHALLSHPPSQTLSMLHIIEIFCKIINISLLHPHRIEHDQHPQDYLSSFPPGHDQSGLESPPLSSHSSFFQPYS